LKHVSNAAIIFTSLNFHYSFSYNKQQEKHLKTHFQTTANHFRLENTSGKAPKATHSALLHRKRRRNFTPPRSQQPQSNPIFTGSFIWCCRKEANATLPQTSTQQKLLSPLGNVPCIWLQCVQHRH